MTLYVLDTTLFIDYARGMPAAIQIFRQLAESANELYVCDVIVCEALSGGNDDERAMIEKLLEPIEYVATHPDAARWAAESRRRAGKTSRRNIADAMIAGFAWFSNATVVTRNPDDFVAQGIPVLTY